MCALNLLWRRFVTGALMVNLVIASAQAAAQSIPPLTETFTTSGGLSASYPEGWTASEVTPEEINLLQVDPLQTIQIAVGSAASAYLGEESGTAAERVQALVQAAAAFGDSAPAVVETVQLEFGTGSVVRYGFGESLPTLILAADQPDGTFLVVASSGLDGEESLPLLDLLIAIAETVRYSGVQAAATGETEPEPFEGALVLNGFVITLPEPYQVGLASSDDTRIEFLRGQFVDGSLAVDPQNEFVTVELVTQALVPLIAESIGDTDFALETALETIPLDDGREVRVYNSRDAAEQDIGFYVLFAIIELNESFFAYAEVTIYDPSLVDQVEADVVTILAAIAPAEAGTENALAAEIQTLTCSDNSYNITFDELGTAVVNCPATCTDSAVWGTGIYTDDSAVCTAAIHAGVITAEEGGLIRVTLLPGLESYGGSEANGIISGDWGEWGGSFSVSEPSKAQVD